MKRGLLTTMSTGMMYGSASAFCQSESPLSSAKVATPVPTAALLIVMDSDVEPAAKVTLVGPET